MPHARNEPAHPDTGGWVYNSETPVWNAQQHHDAVLGLIPKKSRVLEVGCGTGHFAKTLADLGHNVTAIEVSDLTITNAKKNSGKVNFQTGSAYDDLKSKFGQFDIVIAVEVIEHLVFPKVFMERAYDALVDGGLLITTTPYHGKVKNVLLALSNRWEKHFDVEYDHLRFFTPNSLTDLYRKTGFSNFQLKMIGKIPFLWNSFATAGTKTSKIK